jgi:cobalt transporter subunit CbtB
MMNPSNGLARTDIPQSRPVVAWSDLGAVASVFVVGVVLVLLVGFASIGMVHNAAHDARHSFAFACH